MGMTSNHTHVDGKGGTCHGFAAVNLEFFGNAEEIKKHLSVFLDELRNSPKADENEKIYTHGEKEILAIEKIRLSPPNLKFFHHLLFLWQFVP